MSTRFLDQDTISTCYDVLSDTNYKNGSELFTLLILKHAGLTTHDYLDLSSEIIKSKLLEATKQLSYLFVSDKYIKDKYNFINPLTMFEWGKKGKNPTESIQTWATARLINNVTGGGKQWKSIITSDPDNANLIKLKYNYLEFFKSTNEKISLEALSLWGVRFNEFEYEVPLSNIISNFYSYFDITEEEKSVLFSISHKIDIKYTNERVTSHFIRSLIGNHSEQPNWLEKYEEIEDIVPSISNSLIQFDNHNNLFEIGKSLNAEFLKSLLNQANQAILMGPPGTSKSFLAVQLSESFNVVKRLQFHPQYSYQDLIGGKILEQGNLVDKKGELIILIEDAMLEENKDKEYLLIIEEINRANVSQVFGEMIQLLDRGETLNLTFNDEEKEYQLPTNLKIVGTMNTTDRTVGRIDYAIKRRFYQIYCKPDIGLLIDKVIVEGNEFSIAGLLEKINQNLFIALSNKEMVIGHAIFMKKFVYSSESNKFIWPKNDFENLFNYVVVPIIEDYCNGNIDLITSVIGEKLYRQDSPDFINSIQEYLN